MDAAANENDDRDELFVANKWRYFGYPNSDFCYLMDAASDYLGRAPALLGRISSSAVSRHGMDLRTAALRWAASAENDLVGPYGTAKHALRLRLLGGRILARFTHTECLADVARYFSCSHDDSYCSPDVIVDCDWRRGGRHLFRARPAKADGTPLVGVLVQGFGEHAPRAWVSTHPPLPPLAVSPFRDRFAALHGAVIRRPDGGAALILGERNAGKSSCAIELSRRPGVEVLADETAFVHLRTAIVEPFPQSVGVWSDRLKLPKPASEVFPRVAKHPANIDRIVLLEPGADTHHGVGVDEIAPVDVLRAVLPHLRDVGGALDEVMVTLVHLVDSAKLVRLRFVDRADMLRFIPTAVGLGGGGARS